MARRVTFGIRLSNNGPFATAATIKELATLAEALGFDVLWVNDHVAWPTHRRTHFSAGSVEAVTDQPPDFYESLTSVAYLAAMTRRVRVGIAGLVVPWRDPRVLAKQMATIHEMSGGRFIPALAIGRFEDEFEAQQVPYRRRGRLTDEYLACLAAILGPDPLTDFSGEQVQIAGAEYFPKPQGLPIWICGSSPPALRRVARYARGWLPGQRTVEDYAASTRALAAVLAEHGRSPDEIERGFEVYTTIADTDEAAHRMTEASQRHQWGDVAKGVARSLVGSPATVIGRIRDYIAAGVTHFELKFICHTPAMMREMMERYADAVVQEFR
ncbi:MAG: TIGR03619 family F420-dependent LLM class oxidoreductase [Armatimonadetes bacterium]|nr:TIGR03619 family F420-dependent LLM class oxidoreductase [Armatimonadota bacterium]